MKDYKEFFRKNGSVGINRLENRAVTFEQLYQAFKARLMDEVKADVNVRSFSGEDSKGKETRLFSFGTGILIDVEDV